MIEFDNIYNMDCVLGMKQIPDNTVDLVVTSPPYNIGIDYDSYDDNMEWEKYYQWTEEWLLECYRVIKPDGRIAVDHYLSFGNSNHRESPTCVIYDIMERIGYKHHAIALWTDSHLTKRTAWGSWLSSSAPYVNCPYEAIIIGYKDRWKRDNEGVTNITKDEFVMMSSGLWKIRPETRGLTKANFPIDFASKIIRFLSYEKDVVLDPFMGSGTTAIAAMQTNRHYIGFELSGNYCKIADRRIFEEKEKARRRLF